MTLLVIDYPQIDPVFFHLGPLPIRWYSLGYLFGIILAYLNARFLAKRFALPITKAQLDDFIFWATIGIIAGGRLGFVLFYNPGFYLANPLNIFTLWDGGMSFHGGFLGVILGVIFFCRANKIPLLTLSDLLSCSAPIGIFLVRIANFINGELWGRSTNVSWAMVFPDDPLQVPRHPSQLYEAALEGLLLFALTNWAIRVPQIRARPGLATALFFSGYGLARFLIEYVREPDRQFDGTFLAEVITMGQILSLPMIFAGAGFAYIAIKRRTQAA